MTQQNPGIVSPFFRYRLHHILFWLLYTLLQTFIYNRFDGTSSALFNALIVNTFHATSVYFNLYFLFPRLFLLKRYLLYTFMLLCTVFLSAYALLQVALLLDPDSEIMAVEGFMGFFAGILFTVTATMMVKIAINWYQEQQMNLALEKQKAEAELKFLKSQIQPHFLFNVLNNIYSLALQKSDRTPDVVLSLSDFLRYILYETGDKKIALKKEIEYLQNYIELQKLRFGNRADIRFTVNGTIGNQMIESMIFITFIENSFKHGVGSQLEKVWVKIDLELYEHELVLNIRNSKPAESRKEKQVDGGIGLENVQRRLQLLYPAQHTLLLENLPDEYHVMLKLQNI